MNSILTEIDITKLKECVPDIELLKMRIATGKAIIFTGAGFSCGTKNILGNPPPLANDLAKKLCELSRVEPITDLRIAAEIAIDNASHDKILDILKDNYTLSCTSQSHENICALPWRRFYTTNYDNSIELSSLANQKRIESIDLSASPQDFSKKSNVCLHINGKIDSAVASDLTSSIKLSDSSYLSADSFVNSNWYYHFKKDLGKASAIVFIGYSMYDLDVKKFLFETPELAEKTYFIIKEDAGYLDSYSLKKYGHILKIGVNGFAEIANTIELQSGEDIFITESLLKYEISNSTNELRDIDSEKLFLYGDYERDKLQNAISSIDATPCFIKRDIINRCVNDIKSSNNVLLLGDLGNGKSLLVDMLAYELSINGDSTYLIKDNDGDYINDFDEIKKHDPNSIIIIDDFSNYIDLLNHIKIVGLDDIRVILSDRVSTSLNELADLNFIEHHIDILTSHEIEQTIQVIDNLAAWNEFSSLSNEAKSRLIKEKYNSQISLVLLGLMNSPNIKGKIKSQTEVIYSNPDHKKTVFCICLCEIANVTPNSSIVSELANNNAIYEQNLRSLSEFKQLFKLDGPTIKSKSSILALSLLNNTFTEVYVRDTLLDIVERIDKIKHGEHELNKIFKSLLRFHVIERIMPQRKSSLDRYYEQLKFKCPWLLESPHYWVQYAMCRLAFSDYTRAQNYLTNAYSKAEKKTSHYHTDNIDTQQARLYLNQCLDNNNNQDSFRFFEQAHKILYRLPIDGRKFRQILLYKDVFEKKYSQFSNKHKVIFKQSVNSLLSQIEEIERDSLLSCHAKQAKFIYLANESLTKIIAGI